MKEDFSIEQDFGLTEKDEQVLSGLKDEARRDPITGRKEKKTMKSTLNKRKLSKHEMDELFLDF